MNTITSILTLAALAAPLGAQEATLPTPPAPQPAPEAVAAINTTALSWYGLRKQIHAIATSALPRQNKLEALNALRPQATELGGKVRFYGKYHVLQVALPLMPQEEWDRLYNELSAVVAKDPELFLTTNALMELMDGEPAPATIMAPAAPQPATQPAAAPQPDKERLAQDAAGLLREVVDIVAADRGKEATIRDLHALLPRARELGESVKLIAEPHVRQVVESLGEGADKAREHGEAWKAAAEPHVQHAADALRIQVDGARELGEAWLHAARPHVQRATKQLIEEAKEGRIPSEEELGLRLINALLAPLDEQPAAHAPAAAPGASAGTP